MYFTFQTRTLWIKYSKFGRKLSNLVFRHNPNTLRAGHEQVGFSPTEHISESAPPEKYVCLILLNDTWRTSAKSYIWRMAGWAGFYFILYWNEKPQFKITKFVIFSIIFLLITIIQATLFKITNESIQVDFKKKALVHVQPIFISWVFCLCNYHRGTVKFFARLFWI